MSCMENGPRTEAGVLDDVALLVPDEGRVHHAHLFFIIIIFFCVVDLRWVSQSGDMMALSLYRDAPTPPIKEPYIYFNITGPVPTYLPTWPGGRAPPFI